MITIENNRNMYLEQINGPADVKKLSLPELKDLAAEIRSVLLKKLSEHGGHIGPNLGMVEATVALHYVFDSPNDKIVYDVSHQSYTHKILTGRKEAFLNPASYDEVSGYSNPEESAHDFFNIGHTSTAVSLACGLAKARDLKGTHENIIAVLGDGSLSGGEALEGLDNAAEQGTNLIIVLNDNQMSIAENHGGLYRNLAELRATKGAAPCNFFKAMGLDYLYVDAGNDIESLIAAFRRMKDTPHPVVIHINTLKGKGYLPAERDKEPWHWGFPFELETGRCRIDFGTAPDYHDITADCLLRAMKEDSTVVGITAGTPAVMGFTADKRARAGRQFVDVGICEEHAVALASGIAKGGGKPVWGVYSSFLQRSYDQLSQDLCINRNPACILVFLGSLMGLNDVTHLGFFDIPLLGNIPNMVYLAPTCREEYEAMLAWGISQNRYPVAIRVPGGEVVESGESVLPDYSDLCKYKIVTRGSRVAVLGLGAFLGLGRAVVAELKETLGLDATLINPRFITGLDEPLLTALRKDHDLVITLEDGVLDGGFGEKIARYYGPTSMRVLNYGAKKEFVDRYDLQELLRANRLTKEQICEDVAGLLG